MAFVGGGWRSGQATDPAVNTGAASTATVASLAPTSNALKSVITLTVTGTGFTAATKIYAAYSPMATIFDSATQLRCTSFSTTPDSGAVGTIPVGVVKPGEKISNTVNFTASAAVQGFSVLFSQDGPTTFLFSTDESSEHTNQWDFGDGTPLVQAPVGESVLHRFSVAGNYTVTCQCHGATETTHVVITVNDPHRSVVIAIENLSARVVVEGSTPNRQVRILWGDGQESTTTLDGNGAGTSEHTYATSGSYHAEARDASNNILLDTYDMIVPGNMQTARVITYGHYMLNYEFLMLTDTWQPVHGETVVWDFGDGAVANDAASDIAVAHTFDAPGEYTVTCTFPGGTEMLPINATEVP